MKMKVEVFDDFDNKICFMFIESRRVVTRDKYRETYIQFEDKELQGQEVVNIVDTYKKICEEF